MSVKSMTVGETVKTSVAEIKALPAVKKAKAAVEVLQYEATAWTGLKVGQEKFFPTWVLPEKHQLVAAGLKAAALVHQKKQTASKWVFSTNGVASAGRLNIPTIGFGPSNEIYAHSVNENMEFVKNGGTVAYITKTELFEQTLQGKAGTTIVP